MGELTNFINGIADKYKNYWCSEPVCTEVSIVVPAFNTEAYLEQCLVSILMQTFKNYEVIIVNDGSNDLTPEIANVFQHCDKRFKLISQKNGGLSNARNVGVKQANGEFITFIDSDDWIDENYIETLYNAIKKNNCDIATASIIRKRQKSQKYRVHYKKEKVYNSLQEKLDVCKVPVCCYVWNKLYKAQLVKKVNFKEGVYFEDVIWTPQILELANGLVTVPNTVYWYRVNQNSIVKKSSKKKQFDAYKAKKFLIEFLASKGIEFPKKTRTLTKETISFVGIPIIKIKEYNNTLMYFLFGLILLYKKNI